MGSGKISGKVLGQKINQRGFVVRRAVMGSSPLFPPNILYPDELYDEMAKVGEFSFNFLVSKF